MGFRFRKTLKIAPGIRLNLSKSGVSTTIGKPGVSLNIGKRGAFVSAGIPGSGVSFRKKIGQQTGNDMSDIKYCMLCKRNVQPKRKIGAGSVIAVLLTGFMWLLVIPFYKKRCPVCHGDALGPAQMD